MLIGNNVGDEVLIRGRITEIRIRDEVTYYVQTSWTADDPIPVPAEMVYPFKPAEG